MASTHEERSEKFYRLLQLICDVHNLADEIGLGKIFTREQSRAALEKHGAEFREELDALWSAVMTPEGSIQ